MRLNKIWSRQWKTSELLVIVLVVIAAVLALLRFCLPHPQRELVAVVMVDGETKMKLPLSSVQEKVRISLQEEYGVPVSLEMESGRIRFIDVECPDHLCEKSGWLVERHQSAVCMPNRTVVSVYSAADLEDNVPETAGLLMNLAAELF